MGLAAQLDFTATPRHTKGQLFSWTVYDYPAQAGHHRQHGQAPVEGHRQRHHGTALDIASTRYQAYLTAGVERWKEYRSS